MSVVVFYWQSNFVSNDSFRNEISDVYEQIIESFTQLICLKNKLLKIL